MIWLYIFLAASLTGHLISAFYLYSKSKESLWLIKGLFFGLIAVYLYNKESSQA